MPNDENKIILEFPASNVEIELGTTITFDNISGFLNSDRVTVDGESLTEKLSAMDSEIGEKADADSVYDKTYIDNAFTGVNNSLNTKMDKSNPVGTGSFSLNRKSGTTVGQRSFAEGTNCTASGGQAHAEGDSTTASGYNSHAEGSYTTASGFGAHAEGSYTTASGEASHAEGIRTEAKGQAQHVFGMANISDNNNKYVEIVGNGDKYAQNRSNARTLDWQGNETLAGDLTYNGNKSLTSEVQRLDGRIDALPEPMVFKGTLGVGGTIQTLPTASTSNEGYTYKVITAGTYAGTTAKVGDVFTSDGSTWVLIPSGDEDSDTWRAIKVNGVEKLGNGISSGAVDFRGSANIDVTFDNDGNKVEIATKNIYTQTEVNNLVAQAIVDILPTETKSGSVANFETDLELPYQLAKFGIVATQASGTPTPSTPLPISGWSQVEITHADENMQTVDSVTISLGNTYFGGYVTQDKDGHRRLVVTHKRLALSTLTDWSRITNYTNPFFRATLPEDCKVRTASNKPQIAICDSYAWYSSNQNFWQYIGNYEFVTAGFGVSSVNRVYIRNDDYSTKDDFVASLSGVYIIYELETPIIIDLPDGEPITALNGVNNVFCDSGDTEVTYKLSINKALSNLGGGNRSVSLAKSVEEEVKEEPKDEPETRQER